MSLIMDVQLIRKYNVPTPRYTSYPTVPYWDDASFSAKKYLEDTALAINESNIEKGLSLYIHLPYCESLCTYCGCNKRITKNHAVEGPYIDAVLKEWDMYLKLFDGIPRISELHLGGGTPTFFKPENLNRLISGITSRGILGHDAELSFEAHPGNTSERHLRALRLLGFKRVSLGIQDFDPVVQKTINRIQTFAQVRTVCDQARSIGYNSINMDLIYGLPKQKLSSIEDTVEKVKALRPDRIALYSYAHVPWKSPSQRGYDESDLPTDEEKLALFVKARDLLNEAGYVSIGMDHFALPHDSLAEAVDHGTLHRNFMGYTCKNTQAMIGLGVSSIGDNGNSMGQNEKVVEAYLKKIEAGEFPIIKGHCLTEDDKNNRKAIMNLMCQYQYKADVSKDSDYFKKLKERLNEPIADGLLEIGEDGIRVNEKGGPFIRNICLAFDERFWNKDSKGRVFSNSI